MLLNIPRLKGSQAMQILFVKDPLLPMIRSGLMMNSMLYEKDYGLDCKALLSFQPSNESYEVIALNSNKRTSQK